MAHQGQGYAYIPSQERTRQRPINAQLRSQLQEECQQWSRYPWNAGAVAIVIVNDMVEFAIMGRILNRGDNGNQWQEWQDQHGWLEIGRIRY